MKNILFLVLLFSLELSAQDGLPLDSDCNDLSLTIESNTRNTLRFISKDDYYLRLKDSIARPKRFLLKEDKILYEEFRKTFPDKISEHCIRSKQYGKDQTEEISFCNDRQKIVLMGKEQNFYVFKLDAFEIDIYILFNTENQTIYFTDNYPLIYDRVKIVFDIGYSYDGLSKISYYKFPDHGKTEYFELTLPLRYAVKNYNIIRFPRPHLIAELRRSDISEKDHVCGKFIAID